MAVHKSVFTRVPYVSHKSVYGNGWDFAPIPHPYLQPCATLHSHPAPHAAQVKTNYNAFSVSHLKKQTERTTKQKLSDEIILL